MSSSEYIKSNLQSLADKFFNLKLSYVFDVSYFQHVIVVTPKRDYDLEDFARQQIKFELDFIKLFPYESINFVANGALELFVPYELEVNSSAPKTYSNLFSSNLAQPVRFELELFEIYRNDVLGNGNSIESNLIDHELFANPYGKVA